MTAPDTIRLVPGDDWNVAIETRDEGGLTDISSWTVTYARVELPAGGGFAVTTDLTTPNLARLTCDKAVNGHPDTGIKVAASAGLLRVRAVSPGGDDRTIVFKRVIGVPINSDREATTYFLGIQGPRGFSAYEVALANGFEASEGEWLESLIGWSPELAVVVDGERRVHRVVDWIGTGAEKPVTGLYIGLAGYVATPAEAVDIRGGIGLTGDAATLAVGTVTTLAAGEPATVANAGTSGAAVFDFGIPAGVKGDTGDAYETYGVSVYRAAGILTGSYYADRSASAGSTQTKIRAEIIAGDGGAEVDVYLEVNGAPAYGPFTVSVGTPVDLSGLAIAVGAGQAVAWVVTYMTGNVTEFFAKSYGAVA